MEYQMKARVEALLRDWMSVTQKGSIDFVEAHKRLEPLAAELDKPQRQSSGLQKRRIKVRFKNEEVSLSNWVLHNMVPTAKEEVKGEVVKLIQKIEFLGMDLDVRYNRKRVLSHIDAKGVEKLYAWANIARRSKDSNESLGHLKAVYEHIEKTNIPLEVMEFWGMESSAALGLALEWSYHDKAPEVSNLSPAVDYLIEKQYFNVNDNKNLRLLYSQILRSRDLPLMELLIGKGLPVDMPGISGATALEEAMSYQNLDIAKVLLKAGANPNHKNDVGNTVAHELIHVSGIMDISGALMKELIAHGADLEAVSHGETLIVGALYMGNHYIIEELLKAGANLRAKGPGGESLLEITESLDSPAIMALMKGPLLADEEKRQLEELITTKQLSTATDSPLDNAGLNLGAKRI